MFTISEDASIMGRGKDKKLVIYNPFFEKDMKLPGELTLVISLGLHINKSDIDTARIVVVNPDGTFLSASNLSDIFLPLMKDGDSFSGLIYLSNEPGITINKSGVYTINITIGENVLHSQHFIIHEAGDTDE